MGEGTFQRQHENKMQVLARANTFLPLMTSNKDKKAPNIEWNQQKVTDIVDSWGISSDSEDDKDPKMIFRVQG